MLCAVIFVINIYCYRSASLPWEMEQPRTRRDRSPGSRHAKGDDSSSKPGLLADSPRGFNATLDALIQDQKTAQKSSPGQLAAPEKTAPLPVADTTIQGIQPGAAVVASSVELPSTSAPILSPALATVPQSASASAAVQLQQLQQQQQLQMQQQMQQQQQQQQQQLMEEMKKMELLKQQQQLQVQQQQVNTFYPCVQIYFVYNSNMEIC